MDSGTSHEKVADYFDHEACSYEERYWKNPVAQRIRQAFREVVKTHEFARVLEIGCGTGLDLAHFGSIYPEREIHGIDVSAAMVTQAAKKIQDQQLTNVIIKLGTPEQLGELFPGVKYDHIYVFFGALNTAHDLPGVARALRGRLNEGGTMVLTFVNKWYVADMVIHLLRFRFRAAFKRLQRVWGGYSEQYFLASRCYSPREIRQAFGHDFAVTGCRGYSILYPAWYRLNWVHRLGRRLCDLLWDTDRLLNHTPAWCLGEYALYALKVRK
jgi:ubiquinone/menaquinone biosynthesis C-methylase UbiE